MTRRRSNPDNLFDFVKFIAVLIFFVLFVLLGGDFLRALEVFAWLVKFLLYVGVFIVVGIVIFIIVRRIQKSSHPASVSSVFKGVVDPLPLGSSKVFTQELLNALEWRRFEMLIQALFEAEGMIASRIRVGADGGVDLGLRETPQGSITAIVQCKAWKVYKVGVKPVRELFGVMHAEGVPRAIFFTSGCYTFEARAFASGKPLDLIDGVELLERLNKLDPSRRDSIFEMITKGDFMIPTCPSCDTKMVHRIGQYGDFWGCRSYPHCRQKFRITHKK